MKIIISFVCLLISNAAFSHDTKVVPSNSAREIPFPGHRTFLLSDSNSTPSQVAFLELEIPAKTFGAPPHVHKKEDEHYYILDGSVEFLNGDNTVTVNEGGLLVLPRGSLHGFWNASNSPARMLLVVSPGNFASFFDDVVAKIRKENATNPEMIGKIIAQEASKYDVIVHPDKIPSAALPLMKK